MRAAVENGADAVYFGLSRFNARLRAHNFTEAQLPELMTWLHRRGVKGYVTFNTLVFPQEFAEAESYLRTIIAAGADAVIAQDVGVCRLIRQLSSDFPIHASTQMTITSAAGVEFARELGCQLVVLARENTVRDLEAIQAELGATSAALPLEVFVHGALCVAYSGQCLTSEALGGRSANRGECAQACRLPYELLCDGRRVDLGDRRYLLSPQDLAGLRLLPDLIRTGLASLKIEGRLKSAEYVASITRVYREALDRCFGEVAAEGPGGDSAHPGPEYEMEMAFSRGLFTGWLGGIDNQSLVHARFGKKRGAYLGRVLRVTHDRVWVRLEGALKAGDGIVFDAGRPDEPEEGGRVFTLAGPATGGGALNPSAGRPVDAALAFMPGAVNFAKVEVGHRVWKTSDPELDRSLRQSFADADRPRFQRPLDLEVHGRAGESLTLIVRDEPGNVVQVASSMALVAAEKHPLETARLRDQLGRLGGSPFRLGQFVNRLEGAVHLPVSELNRLRREAVERLDARRAQPRRWQLREGMGEGGAGMRPSATAAPVTASGRTTAAPKAPQLSVLVRTLAQLEAVLPLGLATVLCEFEDPKRYREAVGLVRARARGQASVAPEIWVAPPRVFKPGEEWVLKQVRSSEADGYLVRNYDHLRFFAGDRRRGDFSLNVANAWTAAHFLERYGLEFVTASYDLNADQLEALLRSAPPEWFEITLHQHVPMFHMEHCVFCAFLSSGKDFRDCGRPCDRHDLRLRDRVGAAHPVKADAGCRNTVFNARAQTGAEHVPRFLAAGARRFRLEFLDESPADLAPLVERYRRLLAGEIDGATLWREFRLVNQLGVTRGQLGRATGADLGVNRWANDQAFAEAW